LTNHNVSTVGMKKCNFRRSIEDKGQESNRFPRGVFITPCVW